MNTFSIPLLAALVELIPFAGMLIGFVAIVTPFAFIVAIVAVNSANARKKAELHHATIRLALEKGQPLPPELLNPPAACEPKRKFNDRKAGLILIAVGIGLYFFFASVGGPVGAKVAWNLRWASLMIHTWIPPRLSR